MAWRIDDRYRIGEAFNASYKVDRDTSCLTIVYRSDLSSSSLRLLIPVNVKIDELKIFFMNKLNFYFI